MSGFSDETALLHVIAQQHYHMPAFIVGNRLALENLRAAINAALATGAGHAAVFANDGEGYGLHVAFRINLDDVPYGYTDRDMCPDDKPWPGWMQALWG